jgi:CrcB protein
MVPNYGAVAAEGNSGGPKHTPIVRINFTAMLLWIGLGGAAGSILRYLFGSLVQRSAGMPFPIGTLAVNVVGCFIMGLLAQHYMNSQTSPQMRVALMTGFCGGFTTFSAFSMETVGLMRGGEYGRSAAYVVLSVTLSILATFSGMAAARAA